MRHSDSRDCFTRLGTSPDALPRPMQGSKPSKLSKDLYNVQVQLRTRKPRSAKPRYLKRREMVDVRRKRDALKAEMQQGAEQGKAAKRHRAVAAVPPAAPACAGLSAARASPAALPPATTAGAWPPAAPVPAAVPPAALACVGSPEATRSSHS